MTAGAVLSGAYFGDKMSPLSDTTNLAPAMAGSELFDHIKYMAYTTSTNHHNNANYLLDNWVKIATTGTPDISDKLRSHRWGF